MSTITCTIIPATAKKRNNFTCCKTMMLRDDFLSHFRKILFNNRTVKVNKCFSAFFCHMCLPVHPCTCISNVLPTDAIAFRLDQAHCVP